MVFGEIKKFTIAELKNFTHFELSLPIEDLLYSVKSKDKSIPISTYEKLLSLSQKLNINASTSIHNKLSISDKIALLSLIVQILSALVSPSENTCFYNDCVNIQVQIEDLSGTSDNVEDAISDICDEIINTLNKHKN